MNGPDNTCAGIHMLTPLTIVKNASKSKHLLVWLNDTAQYQTLDNQLIV